MFTIGRDDQADYGESTVPGTGNNGTQSWEHGYRKLLGREQGLGYDVCYVSPPVCVP